MFHIELQFELDPGNGFDSECGHLATQLTCSRLFTEALQEPLAQKAVQMETTTENGLIIKLQPWTLYAGSRSRLIISGKRLLDSIAPVLNHCSAIQTIRVVGFAHDVPRLCGAISYVDNWDTSARRSAEIIRYLIWIHQLPAEKFQAVTLAYDKSIDSEEQQEAFPSSQELVNPA